MIKSLGTWKAVKTTESGSHEKFIVDSLGNKLATVHFMTDTAELPVDGNAELMAMAPSMFRLLVNIRANSRDMALKRKISKLIKKLEQP